MSKIIDNGNGTVTLPKDLLVLLAGEYRQTTDDVETTIQVVARLLQMLGIVTKEGKMKENFRFRDIVRPLTGIVADATMNQSALQKKFSFIGDPKCIAIIEKYAYTYTENPALKQESLIEKELQNF